MFVDFNILNQLGSPAINSNTFANRPAAGQTGRLFVSIDTFEIYRDNGTTWDLIGGPGSSTITGTGTATQVAYFTSSQAIGSSANLFWDNANTRLGIGTATPGVTLDIHSNGIMAHFNTTSATGNSYFSFQRTGTNVWRLGDQYNAGANFFQIHNPALSNNAVQIDAATNKTTWQAVQTYTTGLARANYLDYNLSVAAGGSFTSPNSITALGASLDLTLAGSATIPSGARSGLDAYNSIAFTGAGTLTHNQGAQIRAYSNVTAGWAFNGSATGTVTHLAGLRALFPDNTGSAINVTNNYALLLNDQTPNTGTVTYTNRWGVYQEGASDLNYFAANTLIGTTVNNGDKLQVNGGIYTSSNTVLTNTKGGIFDFNDGQDAARVLAYKATGSNILFYTNPNGGSLTLAATINSSGNLGLSVTPSAWGSLFNNSVLQVNTTSILNYNNNTYIGTNYYATNSQDLYINNGFSSRYVQSLGQHYWETAASGTAGNAISFTQAMTLAANGNLTLGTTSSYTGVRMVAESTTGVAAWFISANDVVPVSAINNGGTISTIGFKGTSTANAFNVRVGADGENFVAYTSNTERMRITSGGNLLVGTTTDAGYKLDVNGTGSFSDQLTIKTPSSSTAIALWGRSSDNFSALRFQSNTGATTYATIYSNASDLIFENNGLARLTIASTGAATFSSSVTTGAPTTGTAAAWKLGSRVAAAVALDATQYIELDVAGTLYKLAIVT
jgi:hypothetical protein